MSRTCAFKQPNAERQRLAWYDVLTTLLDPETLVDGTAVTIGATTAKQS